MFTAIPIVHWTGFGPDMNMMLYHNSGAIGGPADPMGSVGFSLGDGWSISYSDHLILTDPQTPTNGDVYWVHDNGRIDDFTWNGSSWEAPPDVHDVLTQDASDGDIWRIRHKDQSWHKFDTRGGATARLVRISGDVVQKETAFDTILEYEVYAYNIDHLKSIRANDRELQFVYDGDLLAAIVDPIEATEPSGSTLTDRTWIFHYDANWRLSTITDPMDYEIDIDCEASGRIYTLTDRFAPNQGESGVHFTYTFTYDVDGRVEGVYDPDTGDPDNDDGYVQSFTTVTSDPQYTCVNANVYTKYFDRRGALWGYTYNVDYDLPFPDGNLNEVASPTGNWSSVWYDSDRNVTSYRDELYRGWDATYDTNGNMLTKVVGPGQSGLNLTYTWTYDPNGFNTVTSYTDPEGNTTQYEYDHALATTLGACDATGPTPGKLCARCVGGNNDGLDCTDDDFCPGGVCALSDHACGQCTVTRQNECFQDSDCDNGTTGPCIGGICTGRYECDDDLDCGQGNTGPCILGTCEDQAPSPVPYYPTLLTKITQPPDGQGNPAADTTFDYYWSGDAEGQLKSVTDPNGVVTNFAYDSFGQVNHYAEGEAGSGDVYWESYTYDSGSRMVKSYSKLHSPVNIAGCGGASTSYDLANRPTDSSCPCQEALGETGGSSTCGGRPCLPNGEPRLYHPYASLDGATYTARNQLLSQPVSMAVPSGSETTGATRTHTSSFDYLGRVQSYDVTTTESGVYDEHIDYVYDIANGYEKRTGSDGTETQVWYDAVGRVETVMRGFPGQDPLMHVEYEYDVNNLVHRVTNYRYVSGQPVQTSAVEYEYDIANRVTSISHLDAVDGLIRSLNYTYTDNSEPETITEDTAGQTGVATTTFTYDDRGRLIREIRTGLTGEGAYDFEYQYDQGGNRTVKIGGPATMPAKRYDYIYDTSSDPNHEDSLYHSSANNRLMRVDRHAGISAQDALDHVDDYFYNLAGNVTRIVSHDVAAGMEKLGAGGMGKRPDSSELADSVPYADTDGRRGARAIELARDDGAGGGGAAAMSGGSGDPYTAVRFVYAENGRTVTFAMGEHWYWDGVEGSYPTGYGVDWGREFRYDGARQRYLERELSALELESAYVYATATTNTHYDGDSPYWSVKHETGNPDDVKTGFELGTARINDLGGTASTDYYHTDMLGTTRFLTDASGGQIELAVYTSFGELVSGTSGRFGYVGAHGYQTSDEMPYQHVGARYYDPTTGRFLQRDPIGVRGGINVYQYVRNGPTLRVDPDGLSEFDVEACDNYCQRKLPRCLRRAGGNTGKVLTCQTRYSTCQTNCGNADIDSEQGKDVGPPPYGPPPATFDPWPSGGWRWRAIALLLMYFLSLCAKRAQLIPRMSTQCRFQ